MTVKPTVVCRYATYPGNVVLADAAKLVEAVPAMDSVRIITELPEVLDAIRAWCAATGTVILREDESQVLTVGGCIVEYKVDLRGRLSITPVRDRTGPGAPMGIPLRVSETRFVTFARRARCNLGREERACLAQEGDDR